MHRRVIATAFISALLLGANPAAAAPCGPEGIWVQILGSGGPSLSNDRAGPSLLVWINGKSRLLVGAGSGVALRFDEAGGDYAALEAILLPNLQADYAGGLANLVRGSWKLREAPLPVIGPTGNDNHPGTKDFVFRLLGPDGAFPALADYLTWNAAGGYRLTIREVLAVGRRPWSQFGSPNFKLSASPVHHGTQPTLAWRVDTGTQGLVLTGPAANRKGTLAGFAKGADMMVAAHGIPEGARGTIREQYMTPTQIGRLADLAEIRFLMIAHRGIRTLGREYQSRSFMEAQFDGDIRFTNDLDCWGI